MKKLLSISILSAMTLALGACTQKQQANQPIPPGYHRMSNGMLMKNVDMNMR